MNGVALLNINRSKLVQDWLKNINDITLSSDPNPIWNIWENFVK